MVTVGGVLLVALAALYGSGSPASASYPGKNGPVVFANHGDIFAIQINGTGLRNITHDGAQETEPQVSPNGTRIAFEWATSTHTSEILTSDLHAGHATWVTKKLSQSGGNWLGFHQPTWSPDGSHIAFVCQNYNFDGLCITSSSGGKARIVAKCGSCGMAEPDWGKGNQIVFMEGLKLYIVGASGHPKAHKLNIKPIDNNDAYGYKDPTWSPNGQRIAFTVGDVNEAIDVVNADGSNHKRLIISPNFGSNPTDYEYPAWSPDGTMIALHVASLKGGLRPGLYTMKPDGTGLTMRSSKVNGSHLQLFWGTR